MQPVRVMVGGLTNRIYAVRRYSERGGGLFVAATGGKDDVTTEAILAVREHVNQCRDSKCVCKTMFAPLVATEPDPETSV
jgi:hypothetical protein